ncbi:MAG: tripartite tricarboxylate transporter substrate-binding protein [Xanthobacteraceae bacterium]
MMKMGFALVLLSLLVRQAWSEDYPSRPVRVLVPSSPGGITDTAARIIGQRLAAVWGQPVVIENRPGGGGTIGTAAAARATPDGYTLLATTNGEFALGPAINPNISYDPQADFKPIIMATFNPIILIANTSSPYNTIGDLIDAAKKKPGEITWASPGVGTWNDLAGEWFQSEAGIKLTHVPYRGGGPAATAVAAGDVPTGVLSISSAEPFLQAGKVRVLAVMTKNRAKFDPSWPTLAESGVANVDATNWVAFFGPAGIDPAVAKKAETDIRKVLRDPAVQKQFFALGIEPADMTTEELAAQIKSDRALSERIAKQANMTVQ